MLHCKRQLRPRSPEGQVATRHDCRLSRYTRHHNLKSRRHKSRAAGRNTLPSAEAPSAADIIGDHGRPVNARSVEGCFQIPGSGCRLTTSLRWRRSGPIPSVGPLTRCASVRGAKTQLDAFTADLGKRLADPSGLEPIARRVVEMMALALQASLLVRHSSSAVVDAFCATRLAGDWGYALGSCRKDRYPADRRACSD